MHPAFHAETKPHKAAYVMGDGRAVTYEQLGRRANQLAHLLRRRGLAPGDGLGIWMGNEPGFLEAGWAAQCSGLSYTPISPLLSQGEVAYIVNDCGARALVTSARQAGTALEVADRVPAVHTRLATGTVEGFEPLEPALGAMPAEPVADAVEGRPMLYSSGTTGRPKGVKTSLSRAGAPLGGPDAALTMARYLYGLDEDSVVVSPGPLYHAAPLRFAMATTRAGATVVIMERFDAAAFLELVERHAATHVLVVPTMFVRMLKLPEEDRTRFDLSSLRCCVHGAAPCAVPVKEQMIDWWGPILREYYAGTEENGLVGCTSEQWLAHPGTVGRPILCRVHVLDADGNEVPAGTAGTVYFESGNDFEYHNDPQKTRSSHNDKGWSTLGDIGYVDGDGYLYLVDRRSHTVVSGGVNVYPQEAENVLVTHSEVLDAAVLGVPDEDLGEAVKAVVRPKDMAEAGLRLEVELIDFCKQRLASYKCPKSVDFVHELPRQPTGKLHKGVLKDRYWKGHTTRIV